MDTRKNFTRTTLRIPQKLYDVLSEAAASKHSVNAEIIARLEASFAQPDPERTYSKDDLTRLASDIAHEMMAPIVEKMENLMKKPGA